MNSYYLSKKILKYFPIKEYGKFARVCRNYQLAVIDAVFSLHCQKCHKSKCKIWRKFVNNNEPDHCWILLCQDCLKNDLEFSHFSPALPLKPGDKKDFWVTSDLPDSWLFLWAELPVN